MKSWQIFIGGEHQNSFNSSHRRAWAEFKFVLEHTELNKSVVLYEWRDGVQFVEAQRQPCGIPTTTERN